MQEQPSFSSSSQVDWLSEQVHIECLLNEQAKSPPQVGSHYHIALKASDQTYEELKARLTAAGEKFRETDHGYCKSIYTTSPDGMILEFTCDPSNVAEIDAIRKADAHRELQRWLAGDRRVNNDLRHR